MNIYRYQTLRPYAYHATPRCNLDRIRDAKGLRCATALGALRMRRTSHLDVAGARLNDQLPLLAANVDLPIAWTIDDLAAFLDDLVYFWPGNHAGPIGYGRRHAERYANQAFVFLRTTTAHLLAANPERALFSPYNSGAPRIVNRRRSPRGPTTFVDATTFTRPPCRVVELAFRDYAILPGETQFAASYDGPWNSLFRVRRGRARKPAR